MMETTTLTTDEATPPELQRTPFPCEHADVIAAKAKADTLSAQAAELSERIDRTAARQRHLQSSRGVAEAAVALLTTGKLPSDPDVELHKLRHEHRIVSHAAATAREQVAGLVAEVSRQIARERAAEWAALLISTYEAAYQLTEAIGRQKAYLRGARRGGLDLHACSWVVRSPMVGPAFWDGAHVLRHYHENLTNYAGNPLKGSEFEVFTNPSPAED